MKATTHELKFAGDFLKRGFWLYIWDIVTPEKTHLYYVGRTGDSSSFKAQSPFNRMGQHLGSNKNNNVLRRYLNCKGIDTEKCDFRLVAYGPIFQEAATQEENIKSRDIIAALENALTDYMSESGYDVINTMSCQKPLDTILWDKVRDAFAEHFPKLELVP